MSCPGCPCPEKCLQWPMFCDWVKNGNAEKFSHICLRSGVNVRATSQEYPAITTQLANAGKAIARVAGAVVRGAPVFVSQAEQDRRLEICRACDWWDPSQSRCKGCGCRGSWKSALVTESGNCPHSSGPKW
jgi:hypothetical protein